MYTCYTHGWHSLQSMCPICYAGMVQTSTSSDSGVTIKTCDCGTLREQLFEALERIKVLNAITANPQQSLEKANADLQRAVVFLRLIIDETNYKYGSMSPLGDFLSRFPK